MADLRIISRPCEPPCEIFQGLSFIYRNVAIIYIPPFTYDFVYTFTLINNTSKPITNVVITSHLLPTNNVISSAFGFVSYNPAASIAVNDVLTFPTIPVIAPHSSFVFTVDIIIDAEIVGTLHLLQKLTFNYTLNDEARRSCAKIYTESQPNTDAAIAGGMEVKKDNLEKAKNNAIERMSKLRI